MGSQELRKGTAGEPSLCSTVSEASALSGLQRKAWTPFVFRSRPRVTYTVFCGSEQSQNGQEYRLHLLVGRCQELVALLKPLSHPFFFISFFPSLETIFYHVEIFLTKIDKNALILFLHFPFPKMSTFVCCLFLNSCTVFLNSISAVS